MTDSAQYTPAELKAMREVFITGTMPECPRCHIHMTERPIGGGSFGLLLAIGGAALGLGLSIGGFAVGSIAVGGAAIGFLYAVGGAAFGPAVIDARHCNDAAREFARRWMDVLPRSCQ
jgi:predicted phage tail protein